MKEIVFMFHDVYHESKEESGFQNPNALIYKISAHSFEEIVKRISVFQKTSNCVLTFDDGGDSFIFEIVPILDKYGLKGHFFIATDFIGTKGFLTADQIKDIRKKGHIIGSHTASHCSDLSCLSIDAIRKEWETSFGILESIVGDPVTEVSIPNGNFDKRTLDVLSTIHGVECVFTSFPCSDKKKYKNLHVIGRYGIRDGMSVSVIDRIIKSKFYRLQLRIRKTALQVLKRIFGSKYELIKSKCIRWLK